MTYRAPPPALPPSSLVVHPQRAGTSTVFMVIGFAGTAGCMAGFVLSEMNWIWAFVAAFLLLFGVLGFDGWFTRVRFTRNADATLRIGWRSLFSRRERVFSLADVVDVDVESDEGTSRIVVVLAGERVPLTSSSTSDYLGGKADELRAFLRDPNLPGGGALRSFASPGDPLG